MKTTNNIFRDNKDFYPTPVEVIEQMMMGEDYVGKTILEPSAGSGNIVDWLKENGAGEVIACENDPHCKKLLAGKCRLIADDFLTVTSEQVSHVDMIVMNPPFSDAVRHILHAWEIAPAGCTIIALCNSNSLDYCRDSREEQLYEIARLYGRTEFLGHVFKNAERPTDVGVDMIKLYKEGEGEDEWEGYIFSQQDEDTLNGNQTDGLVQYNVVRELVNRYMSAVNMFDEVMAMTKRINETATATDSKYDNPPIRFLAVDERSSSREITRIEYKKELQKYYWRTIFRKMDMDRYSTQSLREQMNKFIEKQVNVPFTMGNVYRVLDMIIQTHGQRMHKAMTDAFDHICQFSYENCTGGQGWKTNANYMVNRKFIVPYICIGSYSSSLSVGHYYSGILDDITKALCYLTGRNFDEIGSIEERCNYSRRGGIVGWGKWFIWGFFRCKGFKKGTMHFEFLDEDVWLKFNEAVAKTRGWTLPEKGEWQQPKSKLIPRIKKGYRYECKKNVVCGDEVAYKKGKTYKCEAEHNSMCGFITDEKGLVHAWNIYTDKKKGVDDWRDYFNEVA